MQVKGGLPQVPPAGFTPPEGSMCDPPKPVRGMWLFDVVSDPRECENLVESHPEVLQTALDAFRKYHETAIPDLALSHGMTDPASNPTKRRDKAWGPWSARSSKCKWT